MRERYGSWKEAGMSKTANRIVYGEALCRLAGQHMFYVMDADLSKATGTKRFADAYPERFFDMGIAEQDMVATAARNGNLWQNTIC